MRANTHVTLVIDNTAPQTQRSTCTLRGWNSV